MHHRAGLDRVSLGMIVCGSLLLASSAQGEGLKIRDGLWQTTMNNPMTGERTSQECLKDAEIDPAAMLQGSDECQMVEQALDDNSLTFRMECAGGQGNAEGRMFVDGDHGGGEITMKLNMGGQPMDMTMKWDAVRIGDC